MRRLLIQLFFIALWSIPSALLSDTLSLSGNPAAMTINTATAGQPPNNATNTATTYNVSTTNTVRVITGKLNTAMPAGMTLKVTLAAPTGATSRGSITMTTTATNLVTGIRKNTISTGRTVTYTLSATSSAAQVTNQTRTLTLTLQ